MLESIRDALSETLGVVNDLRWEGSLSGGDISHAALIRSGSTKWFVKYHTNAPPAMFETEAQALTEISSPGCIRVPLPAALGRTGKTSWLVLEYLDLTSQGPAAQLGEQLAALHSIDHDRYGWTRNNYIGRNPQYNDPGDNWAGFWRDQRLQPQFTMAEAAGFGGRLLDRGERLLANLDLLMDGHQPAASLLHGDLWAGNKAFTRDGQAVIFDPASYHGDRETDMAMTELFGGFEPDFYAAYQAHSPLPDGYRLRRDLYNLYHVLNHLNLFGAAYLSRCEHMIGGLLSEIN
jgi:fructosamine-3-kinase